MNILNIYTDGACSNNQQENNAGGWGAILEYKNNFKELFGGEANTTNNSMEMTALIKALSALKRTGLTIRVFSDSTYLMSCFIQKWYISWKKNGWINSAKQPIKNKELWLQLLELTEKHDITFYIVKGHMKTSNEAAMKTEYERFNQKNHSAIEYDEFVYITNMNNRADLLANKGMAPYKNISK